MRWLFRLFISLTFLVSFGHDVAHAGTIHGRKHNDLTGNEYHHQTAQTDHARKSIQTKFAARHKPGENHKVYIVEADEEIDESLSHDRLSDQVDFLAAIFQARTYDIYFQYIQKHLHFSKCLSFSPNNKLYLALKVFRL
ncbi:hypothetical protein LJ707_04335 [Mucilaginibacter sp. UR6-1]|uniref:hypothetical protein n=1 Tax=Mucilaginibacter sp. UR6-1 TaxID=1435643 RepID=UPI001E63EA0E|nr:hypothetical protein [Mucilaginibacter sp. UR6-1]MCC8408145.1 hypothetical protein [Mucilaginibacter sp. UR6-1]